MSDEPIIEVRNLKYTFPNGTMALNGIDVDISRGEFIGIIGQNGSGKTTLVKNLSGLLTPPAGAIRVNGKDVTTITQGSLSTIVGYVFQNPDYMLYNMSVRDEVAAGPKNIGLPSEEIEKRIQMALTHVNLLNRKDLYPFHLPVGEKQRVGIASILVMKPSVIIV
ncbi:MAG TPA: ABC transporter ATP-binding protein, partial [Candidatus Bathyarchaeia archaeon]|nr:ABC transporter ATP-binding protein [Candidatus Bathyarchaeia archaeon]